MYFITVFEKIEPNDIYFAEFGDQRTWGYYKERSMATQALHENWTNIHEGCYDYAVIEDLDMGISPYCKWRQWFKYDRDKDSYIEIDEPACVQHLCNFAFG